MQLMKMSYVAVCGVLLAALLAERQIGMEQLILDMETTLAE